VNVTPNDLNAFWMPFSANRQFKKAPRMFVGAKDMHYTTADGREVLDGTAGLWCVNAGHCRPKITEAIQQQAAELDYAPAFQMGHPKAFELANRLVDLAPDGMDNVFFTNSGSESVETALKIALAYHRVKGEGSRFRLIGRERGYHGVNFGGISVGGIVPNRKMFGTLLTGVDHLPHTHNLSKNAFTRGEPEHGVDLADELERIVALHDASTIAAVIVEPVAGSTGVLIPPKGYLKRLREICDKHGILLIFDEVITGYGRLGTPFGADYFDVMPDIMVTAKGLTNGVIPMGAVFVKGEIHDAFMTGPEHMIEFFHGYTYSGHPVSAAVALENLRILEEEKIVERAGSVVAPYLKEKWEALADHPLVGEARICGLMGSIALTPDKASRAAFKNGPGQIGMICRDHCFANNLVMRHVGDRMIISPPLILQPSDIDTLIERAAKSLDQTYDKAKAEGLLVAA